jgi:hypothetical protein
MKRSFHHCISMITLFLLMLISLSLSYPLSPDVKNAYIPACVHCIHHKIENNECMKFGSKDIVTDNVIYEDARDCRRDEKKCGYNGLYFEVLPNPELKMMEVRIKNFISDPLTMLYLDIVRNALLYVFTMAFIYLLFRR